MSVLAAQKKFLQTSEAKASDEVHYEKLNYNIGQYKAKVPEGRRQFSDYEGLRSLLHNKKEVAISRLDKLLIDFEINFTKNGGTVLWSDTAEDAVAQVVRICKKHNADMVVKSKSMVSEEIHLNAYLEHFGIQPIETDLGEFIQQLCGEPPYHILTPAMHKSKEDVAKLFHERFGVPPDLPPAEITRIARHLLREKFLRAKVGITGGNFIVADTGSIVITENEGNARMATSFPEAHIAIVGIEKVVESIRDIPYFLPMLATAGTGQRLTSYNTILSGPQPNGEGPKSMYVVLLNNGRTNLLKDPDIYESLFCIRCGACLNACPIYKTIGGHAYGTTYSGPIGSVISPHLKSMSSYGHLSFASSLCGACSEVCPVRIPIHQHLLANRKKYIAKTKKNAFFWQQWRLMMRYRWLLDCIPLWLKSYAAGRFASRQSQRKSDAKTLAPFAKLSAYRQIKRRMKKQKQN